MPVAETLINAAVGHKIMSFMDGNAGYNQIFMAPEDVHKTAFRVPGSVGLFMYIVMMFGLKNAGATYQRAMNYIYHDLIGRLVEVYIDDVVVKSTSAGGHLDDLRQVLERTRRFGLKMNPKKCAFGVTAGQFLGFLIHERGIEIGLKSQAAVKAMVPPKNKKELQQLIGVINFVRRFVSNLSGRMEPFMGLVKRPTTSFIGGQSNRRHSTKSKSTCQNLQFWCHLSKIDRSTSTCQSATGQLLRWWSRCMTAWKGSCSTSAEECWTQRPGTPTLKSCVSVCSSLARSFAASCFLRRLSLFANRMSSSICCRLLS